MTITNDHINKLKALVKVKGEHFENTDCSDTMYEIGHIQYMIDALAFMGKDPKWLDEEIADAKATRDEYAE